MKKEDLYFEQALIMLVDKLSKLFKDKDKTQLDTEFFILKFLNSFEELGDYEKIGILESAKNTIMTLKWEDETGDDEDEK